MDFQFSKDKKLKLNEYRIMEQMIHGTIKSIEDAVVELVTNSDDSYKKLSKPPATGLIDISVVRDKNGFCKELKVVDLAGGMDLKSLENALTFAGETSGFYEGKTVRGFFGRGLKEAGLKLGKTRIYSIQNNTLSVAEFWQDKGEHKNAYKITENPVTANESDRKLCGILSGNGTCVEIQCSSDKIKCPEYKIFQSHITNHYSLREINSAKDRKVKLHFTSENKNNIKQSQISDIEYEFPKGKLIIEKQKIVLPEYKDEIILTLYECESPQEGSYNNPYAKSGLLIKSSGALLENTLFKYSGEKAGCYFYGLIQCEGIADRLRNKDFEGIINANRGGLEWKHRYCQIIQSEIEKILESYIEKKKKELEKNKPAPKISNKTQKLFSDLCSLLNKFAKEEIMDLDLEGDEGLGIGDKIKGLIIKPDKIRLQLNKERYVSVYMPFREIGITKVTITSDNPLIQVLDNEIILSGYSKIPTLLRGRFRLIGRKIGEIGLIKCKISGDQATAEASVVPESKMPTEHEHLRKPKGGLFTGIEPDLEKDPDQRVRYDSGKIKIYTNFPSVNMYFADGNLDPVDPEQKTILAELIGEAFCRFMSRQLIDKGQYVLYPGGEIDTVNRAMNDMQKKYLDKIHEALT